MNRMSGLTRDGRTRLASSNSKARTGTRKFHFSCSPDHEQDWQPYPVDPYSAESSDHTQPSQPSRRLLLQTVTRKADGYFRLMLTFGDWPFGWASVLRHTFAEDGPSPPLPSFRTSAPGPEPRAGLMTLTTAPSPRWAHLKSETRTFHALFMDKWGPYPTQVEVVFFFCDARVPLFTSHGPNVAAPSLLGLLPEFLQLVAHPRSSRPMPCRCRSWPCQSFLVLPFDQNFTCGGHDRIKKITR